MENIQLTFCTFNMNGFDRNKEFLSHLCESNSNMICGIQEHWLKPPRKKHLGTNILRTTHDNYEGFGSSAMTSKMAGGVLNSRPFGGSGILYDKALAKSVKPLTQYSHERVSVLELQSVETSLLVFSVYFPYYNHNKIDECTQG